MCANDVKVLTLPKTTKRTIVVRGREIPVRHRSSKLNRFAAVEYMSEYFELPKTWESDNLGLDMIDQVRGCRKPNRTRKKR